VVREVMVRNDGQGLIQLLLGHRGRVDHEGDNQVLNSLPVRVMDLARLVLLVGAESGRKVGAKNVQWERRKKDVDKNRDEEQSPEPSSS
jgi:hypothetical protein